MKKMNITSQNLSLFKYILGFGLILMSFTSCHKPEKLMPCEKVVHRPKCPPYHNNDTTQKTTDDCRLVALDKSFDYNSDRKVMFENPVIDGDFLRVVVGYSGCGKRTNDFRLVWNGSWAESMPPYVKVAFDDTLTGPTCEMYIRETLCFDLSPLKYGGPSAKGSVRVALANHPTELLYKY